MATAEAHGTFFDQKPAGSQQGTKRGNEKTEKGETPSHVQHGKRRKCSCGKCVPYFGMPGGRATHCKECKEQGMVDVNHRRCSCGKGRPRFGMPGGKATHCKMCKKQGMVNVVSRKKKFWII